MLYFLNVVKSENKVESVYCNFKEFMQYIKHKPRNILLLNDNFRNSMYNARLKLYYIGEKSINDLVLDNIYSYVDFSWIDYCDDVDLDCISKKDLLEIIYTKYIGQPYERSFFDSLGNNYLYFTHDDFITHVFMRNVDLYKDVIAGKIQNSKYCINSNAKKISDKIIDYIFKLAEQSIVIDLDTIQVENRSIKFNIYTINNIREYSKICARYEKNIKFYNQKIFLIYNMKEWSLYYEDTFLE